MPKPCSRRGTLLLDWNDNFEGMVMAAKGIIVEMEEVTMGVMAVVVRATEMVSMEVRSGGYGMMRVCSLRPGSAASSIVLITKCVTSVEGFCDIVRWNYNYTHCTSVQVYMWYTTTYYLFYCFQIQCLPKSPKDLLPLANCLLNLWGTGQILRKPMQLHT